MLLRCWTATVGWWVHSFPRPRAGYRQLQAWMHSAGVLGRVGVEGTGSYGAGICRHLSAAGIEVVEVNRPDRAERRRRGKSDVLDAAGAAEAAPRRSPDHHPKVSGWAGGVGAGAPA